MALFKNDVVKENLTVMMLSGFLMGVAFIFFSDFILGLPRNKIYRPEFILSTISAGLAVGFVSFYVVKITIIKRLKAFKEKLSLITADIHKYRMGESKDFGEAYIEDEMNICDLGTHYNSLISLIRAFFLQYKKMDEFFMKINRVLEIEDLNRVCSESLSELFDVAGMEIIILDKKGNPRIDYSYISRHTLQEIEKNSIRDIIKEGKVLCLTSRKSKNISLKVGPVNLNPEEVVFLPILSKGTSTGTLIVYLNSEVNQEDISFMKRLIHQYSLVLERLKIYHEVCNLAAIDELTKLYNRRFGMQRLKEEYNRAKRAGVPLSLVMFDIDHFKKVNDTYGHQAGDYVLSEIASIIKNCTRAEDVVMRYGGEEFLVGMVGISKTQTVKKADEIRLHTKSSAFMFGDQKIAVTISGGISSTDNHPVDLITLIDEADKALYHAKKYGRNRVCVYPEE